MECAAFLRESPDLDSEIWRTFSGRFFACYQATILEYYGYEPEEDFLPRRTVSYPYLFITVMAVLKNADMFDCETTALIDTLYRAFHFTQSRSTLRRWFYDIPPEYEEMIKYLQNLTSADKISK